MSQEPVSDEQLAVRLETVCQALAEMERAWESGERDWTAAASGTALKIKSKTVRTVLDYVSKIERLRTASHREAAYEQLVRELRALYEKHAQHPNDCAVWYSLRAILDEYFPQPTAQKETQ